MGRYKPWIFFLFFFLHEFNNKKSESCSFSYTMLCDRCKNSQISISHFSLNFHLNFHFLNGFITICDFSIFFPHLRGRKTLLGNRTKNWNLPASITNILKYIYIKFQGISRVLLLPWGSGNIIPVMLEVQMQVPPEGVLSA